ncbi:glycosyltransferase [Zobellia galactanivorans]|uniref:glycosyltransferase n=1 Tax=Zobellia galactanivorans (strain DSM 12802 / CCUG 47099 / CIP 106680 / NCIMB 13871 / Dsij) TaxID=63186 RepID=UPI001C066946|nr:glycosyltransferase [Zobellia galactanivorans]MBU3026686.1 glycosyltransferase [Zobellia galactanivorans]
MKKVLHLFPAYKIGGAPVNVLRFIKGSNNQIINYAAALKVDERLFADYLENTDDSFDVDLTGLKWKSFIELLRIVKKIKPDIVHANGKGGAIYAFLIYLFYRKRVFYTFRGFHIKYQGVKHKFYVYFERIFSRVYRKAIAVSHSERELFLKTTQINAGKVEVIGNGVEISPRPLPPEMRSKVDKYKLNIVTLSRIAEVKDIETMVKGLELLNDSEVSLHIMGGYLSVDQFYKEKVDKIIAGLSCKDRIYLWGDIEGAGDYVHNFDLYLSTSLSEGLPTSIIEAGLSEVPVLATDCNGNIDLIVDGKTGYLFPKGDIGKLESKLKQAIDQFGSQQQSEIIANNLKQMKSYSISSHVNKLMHLYSKED